MIRQSKIDEIVELTRYSKSEGQTKWPVCTMALRRLKPHRVEASKLSTYPKSEEKLIGVVGLCLHPPEHTIVWRMDESLQAGAGPHVAVTADEE